MSSPSGLASSPMPIVAPTLRFSAWVITTVPSERRAAIQLSSAPRRIDAIVKVSPSPRACSASVQGARPAASASEARHTSPATMQMPVRTPPATASPIVPSPTTVPAAARTAATRPNMAVYSAVVCPDASRRRTPPVGDRATKSPP